MAEYFISAGAAGEARHTATIPADAVPVNKPIVWPSGDIAEQQEVEKPTGKQNEDDEYSEPLKKPWRGVFVNTSGYLAVKVGNEKERAVSRCDEHVLAAKTE